MRCFRAEALNINIQNKEDSVMKLKKFLSGAVTAALLGTMMCSTVFAAEPSNGTYTGEIHVRNANGSGNNSMCDPIYCH